RQEVNELRQIVEGNLTLLEANRKVIQSRKTSGKVHKKAVKERVESITAADTVRKSPIPVRQEVQRKRLNLPLFPTTTIGSFPQTDDIRRLRARLRKGELTLQQYEKEIEQAITECIRWQESVGLDVLVHGEIERNDMVGDLGDELGGFSFTAHGWSASPG